MLFSPIHPAHRFIPHGMISEAHILDAVSKEEFDQVLKGQREDKVRESDKICPELEGNKGACCKKGGLLLLAALLLGRFAISILA